MERVRRRTLASFAAVLAVLVMAGAAFATGAAEPPGILIDDAEVPAYAAIPAGRHTIRARAGGAATYIAVYERGRLTAISSGETLNYDFPSEGVVIKLFCLDSAFRPVRGAVRVAQAAASQKFVYRGQAYCYADEDEDFDDYIVRLEVVKRGGQITEIRNIAGFRPSGQATNSTNAYYLGTAAAEIPAKIIQRQSTEGVDAVSGATCASDAILRAVNAALNTTPEVEEDTDDPGGGEDAVPDGTYGGRSQCLTGYINYMVDVAVTVEDGVISGVSDRTLRLPMSTRDRELYARAWEGISESATGTAADGFRAVDAVSGATVSSAALNAAITDALKTRSAVAETEGEVFAPEGISLYGRMYPVVTVRDGKIAAIQIVPVEGTDTERLSAFAGEIISAQRVTGLAWPEGIEEDAFALANLTDQILYGKGVLG